jgi:hypothetical protein
VPAQPLILGGLVKENIGEAHAKLASLMSQESAILAELENSSVNDIEGIDAIAQAII